MSIVDPVVAAAARFQERVNQRLAGLIGEGLVIHAVGPYDGGPDTAHGIYVIANDVSPETQLRIRGCLSSLRRPITIVQRVATFEAQEGEDNGDDK